MKLMIKNTIALLLLAVFLTGCLPQKETTTMEEVEPANQGMESDDVQLEVLDMQLEDASDSAMMNGSYTMEEIAMHSTADDCWLLINGNVYDVTEYIDGGKHPGGAALLQGCGVEGTELFMDRPNGSGPHSEQAQGYLENFLIGTLAE